MSVNLESLSSLAATQSDTDYQRHVRIAYQKNLDLQRLIQNLFEVSRIETERNMYSPKWESLIRLLAKLKEKYDDYMEDRDLSFDIDPSDNLEILTDPQKIWSVLDNVLYNSVRHTNSGGITITTRREGSNATVTISDTGRGIPPEHLPHVFERFYKGSQARSTNEGESGLGLYIVKSVMEGCGGNVEIQSDQGKGTSVILTFPARTAKITS
jgi:signal transduction histidine kinase